MMLLKSKFVRTCRNASVYEVGLRDVFEEDKACSPIFSNPDT